MYDPVIARFISIDPVVKNIYDPQSINPYSYARNNPLIYIDPSGETAMEWAIPIGMIVSQLDTPVPGPADAIAGAIIGLAWLYDNMPTEKELKEKADSKESEEAGKEGNGEAQNQKEGEEANGGTYKLRDPESGHVRRTGKSNDLDRRQGEHRRGEKTKDLDFEVDRRTNDEIARRGREQIIHDQHPEADLNKRNPISPKNPLRKEYLKRGGEL